MDKLTQLQELIIFNFSTLIRKAQKGSPIKDYDMIREAMFALKFINDFVIDSNMQTTIIDYYLRKFNNV